MVAPKQAFKGNEKITLLRKILERSAAFLLYIITVYWSAEAVFKYISEPASTTIQYQLGDSNQNSLQFPVITICSQDYQIINNHGWINNYKHYKTILNQECLEQCQYPNWIIGDGICDDISNIPECTYDGGDCCGGATHYCTLCECHSNNAKTFLDHIKECIELKPDIDMNGLKQKLNFSNDDHIRAILLQDSATNVGHELQDAWSSIFSPNFGFCYQFDLRDTKNFQTLSKNTKYQIIFDTYHLDRFVYIFHEANQMPDMSQVRVEEDYRNLTIEIEGKRIIKQPNPPLKRLPCADLDYLTCTDRFFHSKLSNNYNCKASIFNSGKHLGNISSANLEECPNDVILEMLNNTNYQQECSYDPPCEKVEYSIKMDAIETRWQSQSACQQLGIYGKCVAISFSSQKLETIDTKLIYDEQNMIGEVFGTVGLFLGLEALIIIIYILNWIVAKILVSKESLKFISRFFTFIAWLLFVYISTFAVLKYLEEPTNTEISYVKANLKKEFPSITFCNPLFFPFLFTSTIMDPYIYDSKGQHIYLDINGKFWYPRLHKKYGLCYTLDIRNVKNLTFAKGPITFGCKFQAEGVLVLLHEKKDLSSAEEISDLITETAYKYENVWKHKHFLVRKNKYSSVYTKHSPCTDDHFNVCIEKENYEKLKTEHHCELSMFSVSDFHITHPNSCNVSVNVEAFHRYEKLSSFHGSSCKKHMPCNYISYSLISRDEYNGNENFEITLDDTIVQHETTINYGANNLIGEMGAIMTITLGWNVLMILEVIVDTLLRKNDLKQNMKRFLKLMLFLIGIYWSHWTMLDYYYENETMELQLVKKMFPPHVTVCKVEIDDWYAHKPKNSFMKWFHQNFPCGKKYPDYKNSIKACLKEPNTYLIDAVLQYSDFHELPTIDLLSSQEETVSLDTSLWKKVYHKDLGVCYTLDSKYWNGYPILDLKPSDMQNWLWYDFSWNVFIHNANDFPDALTIHPWIKNLPPQTKSEYLLRTKHFSKENVKSKPCSEYQPNSCKDVFLQRSILEKYGCRIAIFYTGKHLDENLGPNLPNCNGSVTFEMLLKSEEDIGNCSKSVPCKHTDYFIDAAKSHVEDTNNQQKSRVRFRYNVPFTEHYHSSVAVDEQTLIGQLGGNLGITIGWSWMKNVAMMMMKPISGLISYLML